MSARDTSENPAVQLLVGWFCPWAQRAWLAAAHLRDPNVTVVNGPQSIVLDTDPDADVHRVPSSFTPCDGISRYMIKGRLQGKRAVPTVVVDGVANSEDDSVRMCQWLARNQIAHSAHATSDFRHSDEDVRIAVDWGQRITKPFYGTVMNKEGLASDHYRTLLRELAAFGKEIAGPYFSGEALGVADCAVLPFVYRLLCVKLLETYRSNEIATSRTIASVLRAHREQQPRPSPDGLSMDEIESLNKVVRWCHHCLQQTWCQATLPTDTVITHIDDENAFFSQSLCDIYQIYAMGIGLKSVNFSPTSIDEVSQAWLQSTVADACGKGSAVSATGWNVVDTVASRRIGVGSGFLGTLYTVDLKLDGERAGDERAERAEGAWVSTDPLTPKSVILKFAPVGNEELREFLEMTRPHAREVAVYDYVRHLEGDLHANNPLPIPRCYYSIVDTMGRGVIVMEDLCTVTESGDFVQGLTRPQAFAACEAIARVQNQTWKSGSGNSGNGGNGGDGSDNVAGRGVVGTNKPVLPSELGELYTHGFETATACMLSDAAQGFVDMICEVGPVSDAVVASIKAMSSEIGTHRRSVKDRCVVRGWCGDATRNDIDRVFPCVTHGDLWCSNILFSTSQASATSNLSAVLIDWQFAGLGFPLDDVATLLATSLTAEERRAWTTDLLFGYHNSLDVSDYTFDDLQRDFNQLALWSALVVVIISSDTWSQGTPERRAALACRWRELAIDVFRESIAADGAGRATE